MKDKEEKPVGVHIHPDIEVKSDWYISITAVGKALWWLKKKLSKKAK